ncbi:hypothetical protein G6011_06138 [Alternaria panax]|uniref:Uncharacterized protein n=1 Tax=Alternaria panax TaxID=48097 RepID=A0AAD4I572_9PLEO|nr:hypothetical protein G6011_06138 [Alternaria panax]
MPSIMDAPTRQVPFAFTPTQTSTQVQSTTSLHEPDVRSIQTNCSCYITPNGQVQHTCTAASYTPQAVVAPRTDPAGRNIDLTFMGSQFDGH